MGWFYGFKLHLVVNHQGEILALKVTAGNVDDREPVRELAKELTGSLYGDKGYLSQELADDLAKTGVTFITKKRRNMKARMQAECEPDKAGADKRTTVKIKWRMDFPGTQALKHHIGIRESAQVMLR